MLNEGLQAKTPAEGTLAQAFVSFKDHFNGHKVSTEVRMLESIRGCHPEYQVTRVSESKFDLRGYARAGHATITKEEGHEHFDATRSYSSPGSRLEKTPGFLYDTVRFGRWKYSWKSFEYLVYEVLYQDPHSSPVKLYYILSPRPGGVQSSKNVATDELLLAVGAWSKELHKEIHVFDNGYWQKDAELWKSIQGSSWEDVILNENLKTSLMRDVQGFFENQQLYKKLAVPWKRGVILHGVPGNGKTISIKALINSMASLEEPVPALYVKSFDACQGEKYAIRSIFSQARSMAPCLLIFEDLDSLVQDETRSYFLNEVDGLESNDGILMIGSTNHLDALDPAISKRPSRFDRKYHFQIPNEQERIAYCHFWQNKLTNTDMVSFEDDLCPIIGKLTEGFSFAYLKELFVISLLAVARGGTIEEEEEQDGTESNASVHANGVVEPKDTIETEDKGEEKSESTEGSETKKEVKKRVMPEVEIPAAFQDNILLKVIKNQVKVLLADMDNTEDSGSSSAKKTSKNRQGAQADRLRAMQEAARARSGCC
ncbi:hypothetical protein EMPS_07826 [Entomortierella parvispora]|uniref:ATPase AAA-type core domain-containing protein n=1 Tax=Entomortierella parvispora TaxID=205924 RepID=A0A9P3HFK9_9FUNG|nr:hypothetical protein EMPS_07826 [Entomortierella parvispora]